MQVGKIQQKNMFFLFLPVFQGKDHRIRGHGLSKWPPAGPSRSADISCTNSRDGGPKREKRDGNRAGPWLELGPHPRPWVESTGTAFLHSLAVFPLLQGPLPSTHSPHPRSLTASKVVLHQASVALVVTFPLIRLLFWELWRRTRSCDHRELPPQACRKGDEGRPPAGGSCPTCTPPSLPGGTTGRQPGRRLTWW